MAMIGQVLSRLSRVRITLGYAAVLIGVSAALVDLGPRARAHVIAQASTNLHNLAHGHLATLLDSAFVTDAGLMYFWLPCLVCLLALAELIWRSGRLAIVFVTGHIGATLLVAVGLTAAIELGWLPLSVSRASDVGVSYGAVAVLGALHLCNPSAVADRLDRLVDSGRYRRGRARRRFHRCRPFHRFDAGHAGLRRLDGPARWTPVRCALLAVSAVFGFFLLVHGAWSMWGAAAVGALGAIAVELIARSRATRRRLASAGVGAGAGAQRLSDPR